MPEDSHDEVLGPGDEAPMPDDTADDGSRTPGDAPDDGAPLVRLERWEGTWEADDPHADLKADVGAYGPLDPLTTLRRLSADSGVPVGALVRYVLARWTTGGNESLLELGVSGVDHLARAIDSAEAADTDQARLEAYQTVRQVVGWLRAGLDDPDQALDG